MKNQIEKKTMKIIFIAFAMAIFLSTTRVFAEDNFYNNKPENNDVPIYNPKFDQLKEDNPLFTSKVNCFDYYKFQSVQVNLSTDYTNYDKDKKNVAFIGNVENENDQPLTNGNVFIRITKKNNNNDWDVVDEFFGMENISLQAKETKQIKFYWDIPDNLVNGDYKADLFFSVGKKFNLGGLPFSNEVVIGKVFFTISGRKDRGIFFNREKTEVNNEQYHHIGNWPLIEKDKEVIIVQPIKNTSEETKKVMIDYDLYYWDSLNEKDRVSSRQENITLSPNSEKILTYKIPQMDNSVYYLKIIAKSEDNQKTIVNIRVVSNQNHPRLNYPAITKFPIKKGDKVTVFSCFHNTSAINSEGRVEVVLKDKNDKVISKMEYEGIIPSAMSADKKEFTAKKDYDYLRLQARVYDKNDRITDGYEAIYYCNNFNACQKQANNNSQVTVKNNKSIKNIYIMIFGVIFAIITVVVIITVIIKMRKREK